MKKAFFSTLAISSSMALSGVSASSLANDNPFASHTLEAGYQLAQADSKDMEGKCGGKAKKKMEGQCGASAEKTSEGKCGGNAEKATAKSAEGLPLPELMAALASSAELLGCIAFVLGLATRWFALPLMLTMVVAAGTAHWQNGWFAIAPSDPNTNRAGILAHIGIPAAEQSLQNSLAVGERLGRVREILQEHGNYEWLTETGNLVVLNNGIEFAATYFIMLLVLFFYGGGRYVSIDYWLNKTLQSR